MLLALVLAFQAVVVTPADPPPANRDLVLSGLGRFAVFADRDSMEREDQTVTLRALQVAETGFEAGGRAYVGGWSAWRFDCARRMGDRLDFSSLAEDGTEGPVTPEAAPARPVGEDGEMAALFEIACGAPAADAVTAASVDEAIALGRARLAERAENTPH